MKKMIIAALALASLATGASAQDVKTTTPAATVAPQDNSKTKVDPANLPNEVKTTLAGEQYKGWTATNAWLVNADPAYYSIELKKDEKTNIVNIDKSGKVK